jgi:predicted RNA polymerase sigma factor
LDAIAGDPRLARYHLFAATRADVLRRLGRGAEADEELRRAAALAPTERERDLLLSRTRSG